MSGEARPISPGRFAAALHDLPVENLYTKASEINNSIAHLQRSNASLQEYSDSIKSDASIDARVRQEGDRDCLDAIRDNDVVIQRQKARIGLLKGEVERRGGRWHGDESEADENGASLVNGSGGGGAAMLTGQVPSQQPARGGRLTDEQLRQQMEDRMAESDDDGMHL